MFTCIASPTLPGNMGLDFKYLYFNYFIRLKQTEMPWQAWLLFLYTGLALRENILRVNGSDIRPW